MKKKQEKEKQLEFAVFNSDTHWLVTGESGLTIRKKQLEVHSIIAGKRGSKWEFSDIIIRFQLKT